MAFFYKDFNKTATDAYKTGKASEYTMKFCHKSGGVTYEGSGTKVNAGKKAGMSHGFLLKGKGGSILDVLGFNLDEINVGNGKGYGLSHKWSNSGLIPDAKIKATISQPWQDEKAYLSGGHFNPIPSSVKLAVEYGSGPIKASASTSVVPEKIQALPELNTDLVFNAGDLNVGAILKASADAAGQKYELDYNLALKYAMGDMSAVVQTTSCCKVVGVSLHNQFDSQLQAAATSTYNINDGSLQQVIGGQYKIDSATTGALNLNLGNLMEFDAKNVSIVASVAQSAGLGKTTAAVSYTSGSAPSFGMKFETKA